MYGTPISCGSSIGLNFAPTASQVITIGNDMSLSVGSRIIPGGLTVIPSGSSTVKQEEPSPAVKQPSAAETISNYRKTNLGMLSSIKMDPPRLMTVVCPDGSITVLFDVISANCQYFELLKNSGMEETNSGKINVQKQIKVARAIIGFIYSQDIDDIEKFSLKELGETYDLARMWTIETLEEIIIDLVKNRATIANCLEIFELGIEFQSEDLEEIGLQLFVDYLAFNARPPCRIIDKNVRRCCIHNFSSKIFPGSCCDYYVKGEAIKIGATTLGCCQHNPNPEEKKFLVSKESNEELMAAITKMSTTNRTRLLFDMMPVGHQ